MPCYEAVVFDLDGTLLDTLQDLTNAVNHALLEGGYPLRGADDIRGFVGNGVGMLISRALPRRATRDGEAHARALARFKAYYSAHNNDCTAPYEGVVDMLERLKAHGIKTAVVSNKNDPNVRALCSAHFPGLISACVGEREGVPRKPAPDMPLNVLAALDCPPQRALYVGDSDVDILTAKNAGMDCASVSWGFQDEARLREAGAARLFVDAGELMAWLLG